MEFLTQALSGFTAMSYWEYLAVAFNLAYLLLAMKQSLWAWPCAFFGTLIYTILFFNGALLMESLLNFYYLVMAVYGFYCWRNSHSKNELKISSWSPQTHLKVIGVTTIIALALGFIMENYTQADFAYLDTFTTCFAVLGTYLVAKKVLENWIYWVVIDVVSIYLFLQKGFYPTVVLFVLFTLLAIRGYFVWRSDYSGEHIEQVA